VSQMAKILGRSPREQERFLLVLVYVFLGLAFVRLWLLHPEESLLAFAGSSLVIILYTGAAHVWIRRVAPDTDPFLLPLTACLSSVSLIMLRRLAPGLLWKQTLWLGIGTAIMLSVALAPRDLRWLRRYRYTWLGLGLFLLALTLFLGVNPLGRGARLWFGIGGVYFQPSELLKVVFIVFLASYLAEKSELIRLSFSQIGRLRIPPLPYLVPLLLVWGAAMVLLAAQQDLGAGTLLFGTFLAMLYVSTRKVYYVIAGLVLMGLGSLLAASVSQFVDLRIDVWLNPWAQPEGGGYQIIQALLSFAAGGISGAGLGLGYGAKYIPVVHTDFVFATIGEELGLCGALAVLTLYLFLFYRGLRIALLARSNFERLLAIGLSFGLALQAWVIAAGNLKIVPLTGVTLPWISYGGSSLTASYIAIGLMLHISSRNADARRLSYTCYAADTSTFSPVESRVMNRSLIHVLAAVLLCFSLLAAGLLYWQVISSKELLTRIDNPRLYDQQPNASQGQLPDNREVAPTRGRQ
jgi:cell division protein FtsW (lipid II flippase)